MSLTHNPQFETHKNNSVSRFEKFMRWMNVILILATFAAYLSPYINPIQFWQFSFFGLIYPWLLLANVLFVVFWILKKNKYALFSIGCIILGWGQVTSFVGFHFYKKIDTQNVIRVGSYNIHALGSLRYGSKTKEAKLKKENNFIQFLKRGEEIQILCTQETAKINADFLQEKFNFPFVHRIQSKGAVIFSKYPFLNKGEIDFGTKSNSCLWADVKINEQKVRIYSIHFQSNNVSSTADKVIAEGDFSKKETFKKIKGMMGKFKHYAQRRAIQAQKVANHMATCPHPIIVCGDFNDTPQSYTYEVLSKNLTDSFKEKGTGFGTTYAGSIPALRIDFILLDKKINVLDHQILKGNFSDHYPVITKISF